MVAEWVKKPAKVNRRCIAPDHESLSATRQCQLLGLARSICYHVPRSESAENLALMRAIDGLYLSHPFSSSCAVCKHFGINRSQAHRPLRLESLSPNCSTSRPAMERRIYPYLLGNLDISQPNLMRASSITSVPMDHGFLHLTAIVDLFRRNVRNLQLSNTLTVDFRIEGLATALVRAKAEILKTNQGTQLAATTFTSRLIENGVAVSVDG